MTVSVSTLGRSRINRPPKPTPAAASAGPFGWDALAFPGGSHTPALPPIFPPPLVGVGIGEPATTGRRWARKKGNKMVHRARGLSQVPQLSWRLLVSMVISLLVAGECHQCGKTR